jgi:photosystem II stability/assembly factor-like uncharacterized protein
MKTTLLAIVLTLAALQSLRAQVAWTKINDTYFRDNQVANCMLFDDQAFYAGSSTGLHISHDNGVTWSAIDYFRQIEIDAIAQNLKGYLYVAGWRHSGAPKGIEGIWRSNDHGASWTSVTATDWGSTRAHSIVVLRDQSLVAGTDDGFLRSTDDGGSWTLSNGRFHPAAPYTLSSVNTIYRAPNDILYAQIGGPLFGRSSNGGTSWSLVLDSINYQAVMSIDSDGRVFVPGDSGVYRSVDNGESWQLLRFQVDQQLYSLSLAASNGWIFGLGSRPILSMDHGESWQYIRDGLTWEYNASAAVESRDHYVYFIQPTGNLWRTKDPLPANAVERVLSSTQLRVYPNPSNGEIHIATNSSLRMLEVFDATGRRVLQSTSINSEAIRLTHLAAGMYLVRTVSTSNEVSSERVIVK